LYAHFGSREGILTAVAIEGFQEMGLALEKARKRVKRGSTVESVAAAYLEFAADMSSAHAELVKTLIPLKRMGDVSEVASFVSYLASEGAGFITGASLTINGGYVA
jgi:NAD(P)-dependent dehydrogenase (short-subunit alcohol dehydrogenase family)